jgi:hypothetical protein
MFRNAVRCMALVASALLPCVALSQQPAFKICDPGTEEIVDYEKYGEFQNVGTKSFTYVMKDRDGLSRASGEGIDPNLSITNNPEFVQALADKKLKDDWWKHVNTSKPQLDYFVWAIAPEDPGVRLLFVGKALEKGGLLMHALKAYRAAMILYPDSACWSAGAEFQWDVATAAWNNILNLLRKHPELNLRLVGADVTTKAEASGLAIVVSPGHLERIPPPAPTQAVEQVEAEVAATVDTNAVVAEAVETNGAVEAVAAVDTQAVAAVTNDAPALAPDAVAMQRGTGTVQLIQYGNGDWKMQVDGKPYFIRGMNYSPTKIGVVPWEWNWLWGDENTNGIADCFEVWVDANNNNKQDAEEPTVSDFKLLKDMGCNTIKLYVTDPDCRA